MKRIYILAAGNVVAGGLVSFLDVFSFCNSYWRRMHAEVTEDLFHCQVISSDGENVKTTQGFEIPAKGFEHPEDILQADAVILAASFVTNRQEFQALLTDFEPLFAPLATFVESEKPLAAYCSGTLLLAASGLLNQRRATTVWWLREMFERNFKEVDLSMDTFIVSDGQFHTAGATTSNLSLALHLVSMLAGEELAQQMSKILLIDPNRSQQPFMTMSINPEQHNDELIQKVQLWMQVDLSQHWSLDDIADKFAVGKRTLIRRFKKAVNETPASYMQRLRVDEAKRLLETTELGIEQIVERVGYEDSSSFRKLFIQLTSLSPRAYRQKFNTHTCC
ncbi:MULTISPECIES: helix-turn-helix domain-containing protein [unclassified Shewanella]|uniref:GlxA family transcriptional regulator n=1 Tax=unclassified Shewanella TaxID=196818 RepID=UPI000C85F73C|nr:MULTISPECIES: helix-turn-helix domain-containing protein [unclassified Shewanella]MDO6640651.1 helix-turn-helix domain-containing protein [Shewanella sp. 5_MG-2023]PMG42101.1 AraC family transcriptional regulator [Shewanella sp. 10N.286.52.B9]